jgi:hypothetical protein
VNDEYGELLRGLQAAERALREGGLLAVVTFHSVEDRMVKRFLQLRAGALGQGSRHAPEQEAQDPAWALVTRKAVEPDAGEVALNPRARSARLRVARRTRGGARPVLPAEVGMPELVQGRRGSGPKDGGEAGEGALLRDAGHLRDEPRLLGLPGELQHPAAFARRAPAAQVATARPARPLDAEWAYPQPAPTARGPRRTSTSPASSSCACARGLREASTRGGLPATTTLRA